MCGPSDTPAPKQPRPTKTGTRRSILGGFQGRRDNGDTGRKDR